MSRNATEYRRAAKGTVPFPKREREQLVFVYNFLNFLYKLSKRCY